MSSSQTCDCFHHGMPRIYEPEGYIARALWMEKKSKTHVQRKCNQCGRYTIWTAKRRKVAP